MKDWDAEKKRYQLAMPFSGAAVMALKKEMSQGDPPHYLCAGCFKKGEPSVLQLGKDKDGWTFFGCSTPTCKSQARTGYRGAAKPEYAEDIKTQG